MPAHISPGNDDVLWPDDWRSQLQQKLLWLLADAREVRETLADEYRLRLAGDDSVETFAPLQSSVLEERRDDAVWHLSYTLRFARALPASQHPQLETQVFAVLARFRQQERLTQELDRFVTEVVKQALWVVTQDKEPATEIAAPLYSQHYPRELAEIQELRQRWLTDPHYRARGLHSPFQEAD